MDSADAIDAPLDLEDLADEADQVGPSFQRGHLKIFARDDGARVRLISDSVDVRDADLVMDVELDEETVAVARAFADLLTLAGAPPDQYGWHVLPAGADPHRLLTTILGTARKQTWSMAPAEAVADLAAPPTVGRSRRRWTHADDVYFAFLVGQGHSAKGIAAELGLTLWNTYKRANRLGLSLTDRPHHETCLRLPADVLARLDSLAATGSMRRDLFLSRWVIKAARGDPGRYGLVMV